MPDWFTEHAPPKAAPNSGGDWFSANAPTKTPQHEDSWGDVASDFYHGIANPDFRKGFAKSVVSDPQMLGAAGATGALMLAPTLPVTGPLALLAAAGLGAVGGAGGAATAHGVGAVVGQEPRESLMHDMTEQGIAGGVAPLIGPGVKGAGILQQKLAGKLAPLASKLIPKMAGDASFSVPAATFALRALTGGGVVEPGLEALGEHALLNPKVGRGMEQLGEILSNPLNALRQSKAGHTLDRLMPNRSGYNPKARPNTQAVGEPYEPTLDNPGGGVDAPQSPTRYASSGGAEPVAEPVQTERAPYGNHDVGMKPRWARADAKAAQAEADAVSDPFADIDPYDPTTEQPQALKDAIRGLKDQTDDFYGPTAETVTGDQASAETSANLLHDPKTDTLDLLNKAIADGEVPETSQMKVTNIKQPVNPSGDSYGARSLRQRNHVSDGIERKRAAIEALKRAAEGGLDDPF